MELIGRYEVLAELGQGGYGRLYRALDRSISRQVAIKVLHSLADPGQLVRFQREAAAAGNLHHKNIIAVYDFDVQEGVPFLVMEILEGRDLSSVMAGPRIPVFEAVDIMQQAAEGLQHAHRHRVIHGDVTPSNIWLMPDGTVKIIDFGIARRLQGDQTMSRPDESPGTLHYLAPECLPGSGGRPDARTDIFSYGVVYYELLAGQHPFAGEEQDERVILCNISINDPAPIQSLAPDCPAAIARVIRRALAKEPELRYQSFRDLILDVEHIRVDLRRKRAKELIKEVEALFSSQQLEAAQAALDQARALDPSHTRARELHEEIQAQIQRKALTGRVGTILENASISLGKRRFTETFRLLDRAKRLDPGNTLVHNRLEAARSAFAAQEKAISLSQRSKEMLEAQNLPAALQYAQEALSLDPELASAREIGAWVSGQLQQDRRQRLRGGLLMSKRLLSENQFADAVALLEKLQVEFSESPEVSPMLSYGREELQKQERSRSIEQARKHAAFGDFDAAHSLIEDTLRVYSGDPALTRMLEAIVKARAAHAPKCAHCQATLQADMKFCDACGRPRAVAMGSGSG